MLYFLYVYTFILFFFALISRGKSIFFILLWWIKVSWSHRGVENQQCGSEELAYIFQLRTVCKFLSVCPSVFVCACISVIYLWLVCLIDNIAVERQGHCWPLTVFDHALWIPLLTQQALILFLQLGHFGCNSYTFSFLFRWLALSRVKMDFLVIQRWIGQNKLHLWEDPDF